MGVLIVMGLLEGPLIFPNSNKVLGICHIEIMIECGWVLGPRSTLQASSCPSMYFSLGLEIVRSGSYLYTLRPTPSR